MDAIFSVSIIASFLAGVVALFAPCCITILLPTYLASVFRGKKNILKMTFVFFLGMVFILLPIGLGAAALAQIFRQFHYQLYLFGGALMVILAVMSLLEKQLPWAARIHGFLIRSEGNHSKSVFLLGMFSGAATSCCAPVLAGAMTLAIISVTFWRAIIVVFAYIFGMTFPLFVLAYFYDRLKISSLLSLRDRFWKIKIGVKEIIIHLSNLIASTIFLLMGFILLVLAFEGNEFYVPSYQSKIGQILNYYSFKILKILSVIPNSVWSVLIAGAFLFFLYEIIKANKDNG
ncbi:hypothetical protein M1513_00680 [Patescibacteria group bacterium]|nr:hypothetical protein [Patescibacteria group bacterium]